MQTVPGPDGPQRFYQLILQEDLLGGWSVIRQFGAMGERGSQKSEHFHDRDSAQKSLMSHRDRQLKRGYSVMFVHGGGRAR